MSDNLRQRYEAGEGQISGGERAYARAIAAAEGDFIEYPDRQEGNDMCDHGFIGACAECDGSGQIPEPDEAAPVATVQRPCELEGCESDPCGQESVKEVQFPEDFPGQWFKACAECIDCRKDVFAMEFREFERVVTCPECSVVGIPHTISRDGHAFISTPTGLSMACSLEGRRVNGGKPWNR